jgi:hypothetical protein
VGVPEEIVFKTKPEIALDQLRWACEAGLPFERASCNSRLSSSSVPLCEKHMPHFAGARRGLPYDALASPARAR